MFKGNLVFLSAIVLIGFNLLSYKGSTQETETKKPTTKIDFSKTVKSTFPKPIGIINGYRKIFSE